MAIILVGDQTPTHPAEFERKLQAFDQDLAVVWHKPPHWRQSRSGVWKIEQCVGHLSGEFHADGRPKHTHLCMRAYVTCVQDEDGTPMPLGDHVFEKLRMMRANSESFGGETERGLSNWIRQSRAIDDELESKRAREREDVMAYNQKFNARQIANAVTLIQRHDMRPNR